MCDVCDSHTHTHIHCRMISTAVAGGMLLLAMGAICMAIRRGKLDMDALLEAIYATNVTLCKFHSPSALVEAVCCSVLQCVIVCCSVLLTKLNTVAFLEAVYFFFWQKTSHSVSSYRQEQLLSTVGGSVCCRVKYIYTYICI